jgi:cobalt-zinc-cadmium efflux system outer membrane protein
VFEVCHRPLCAAMAGVAALALAVAPARAAPAPTFGAMLAEAQQRAPLIAQSQAEIARAEGLARQAGARPNPVFAVGVENFAGSAPYGRFATAETTASLELPLELGGKRSARMAAGRAGVAAARAQFAVAGSDYAFTLAQTYADAEADGVRLMLATDALTLAEDDMRVATALVRAGKEAELREVQARTAVQTARAARDAARAAQATSLAELTAMTGAPIPFTSVPPSLLPHAEEDEPLPQPDPLASPAYRAALSARDAAALRVEVQRRNATPDLTASFGVRRLNGQGQIAGQDATAAVAGLSIPLPFFDRNRGNIDAARAELTAAEAGLSIARFDAEAGARSGLARAQAAFSRIAAARDAERTAEEAYRLSRIGYEGGKLALIEVLNARRALTEARTSAVDARLERLSAEAALARLAGTTPFGDIR